MLKSVLKALGRKITGCKAKENSVTVPGAPSPQGGVAIVSPGGHSENSALGMNSVESEPADSGLSFVQLIFQKIFTGANYDPGVGTTELTKQRESVISREAKVLSGRPCADPSFRSIALGSRPPPRLRPAPLCPLHPPASDKHS